VYGVGDDDQTIYGYNGADPTWLIEYESMFPAAEDHPLEVNYRCPADVVERVDRLLRRNTRRVPKSIRAAKTGTTGLEIVSSDDPVATTVAAVGDAVTAGRAVHEVAVLARVNAILVPVQVALGAAGVGCTRVAGTEFLTRTPVRAALAWLRLATAPDSRLDPADLAEAVRRPSRSLSPRVATWVAEQRSMAALHRLAARIDGKDSTAVDAFVADLVAARSTAAKETTSNLLAEVFDDLGPRGDTRLVRPQPARGRTRARRATTSSRCDTSRRCSPTRRVRGVAPRRALATARRARGHARDRAPGQGPGVAARGGAPCRPDQFPHRLAEDVEEERRLFHVALTRASESVLVVTAARPSPFLRELSEEPSERDLVSRSTRPAAAAPTPARPATPGRDVFVTGTVVAGPGVVLVDQGQEWTVTALDEAGATATSGGLTRSFAFGRKVATLGRQRGDLAPPPDRTPPASAAVYDALRILRERVRNGKPAYTVFDDATVERIALALPATLDRLARVKGIGPAKLEQYGDAVLDAGQRGERHRCARSRLTVTRRRGRTSGRTRTPPRRRAAPVRSPSLRVRTSSPSRPRGRACRQATPAGGTARRRAAEQRQLPRVARIDEDGERAHLRDGLAHQHARQRRPSREVAGEEPLVTGQRPSSGRGPTRSSERTSSTNRNGGRCGSRSPGSGRDIRRTPFTVRVADVRSS
jgi:hypothetical protein